MTNSIDWPSFFKSGLPVTKETIATKGEPKQAIVTIVLIVTQE